MLERQEEFSKWLGLSFTMAAIDLASQTRGKKTGAKTVQQSQMKVQNADIGEEQDG